MIATGALALFTAFLWCSAAITARFARAEILTSSAVSSADLTLKLDNRFNSDRALRIRHGAVRFLAEERGVQRIANAAYLSRLLYCGLLCVAPYFARSGINITLVSTFD